MTLTQVFAQVEQAVAERIVEYAVAHIPGYRDVPLPKAALVDRVRESVHAFGRDLEEAQPHYYREHLERGAYLRAIEQLPMEAFEEIVLIGYRELVNILKQQFADDLAQQLALVEQCSVIGQSGLAGIYMGYTRARNETIAQQQAAIRELATPLVPIADAIIAMPLIGTIDTQRAQQVLEILLEGIMAQQADYAILDITGVSVVDTQVAQSIVRVAQAAKLLGAQVILTGIGAGVAQTMVGLGLDMQELVIQVNLQTGIAYALRLHGLAIQPLVEA